MTPRVARVLVWCNDQKTVKETFDFFTRSLGFKSRLAPSTRTKRGFFPLANQTFSASVTDGNMTMEFASIPWISALRSTFRRPAASQVLAVCIKNVQARSLQENRPGLLESALFLQPLAWLERPSIHPLILCEVSDIHGLDEEKLFVEEQQKSMQQVLANGEEDSDVSSFAFDDTTTSESAHVKEIVFGEADDRLYASASLFMSLSERRLSPGVMSFGNDEEYESLVPVLRIVPSPMSTLIIKVPDVSRACEELGDKVSYETVGGFGKSYRDVSISAPFLQGMNIRLSESPAFESHFVDNPESLEENSVSFNGVDVSSMSCRSVSGMELKERIFRFPSRMLTSIGRSFRPQY